MALPWISQSVPVDYSVVFQKKVQSDLKAQRRGRKQPGFSHRGLCASGGGTRGKPSGCYLWRCPTSAAFKGSGGN